MLVKRASVAFVAALLLLTAAAADAGWQQTPASGATARAYAIRVVVPDLPGAETPTVSAPEDSVVFSGSFDYNIETKSFPDQPQYTPPPDVFARMVLEKIRHYKLEQRIILRHLRDGEAKIDQRGVPVRQRPAIQAAVAVSAHEGHHMVHPDTEFER